jgi:hypothetical protein
MQVTDSKDSHSAAQCAVPQVFDPSPVHDRPHTFWKVDRMAGALLGLGSGSGSCDASTVTAARSQHLPVSGAAQPFFIAAEVAKGDFIFSGDAAAPPPVDTTGSMSCGHVRLPGEEFVPEHRQSGESAAPPIELVPHPVAAIPAALAESESPVSFGSYQAAPDVITENMANTGQPKPSPLSFAAYQAADQQCSVEWGGPAVGSETPVLKPPHCLDSSCTHTLDLGESQPGACAPSPDGACERCAGPLPTLGEKEAKGAAEESQPLILGRRPDGHQPHGRDVPERSQEDMNPSAGSPVDMETRAAEVQGGELQNGEVKGSGSGHVPGVAPVSHFLEGSCGDAGQMDATESSGQIPIGVDTTAGPGEQGSLRSLDAQIADALFDAKGTSLPPGFSRVPISMSDSWAGNADRVEMGSPLKGTAAGSDVWSNPPQCESNSGMELVLNPATTAGWELGSRDGAQYGAGHGEDALLKGPQLGNTRFAQGDVDGMMGRLESQLRYLCSFVTSSQECQGQGGGGRGVRTL